MNDNTLKLAFAAGFLQKMAQHNVTPQDFFAHAQQSNDPDMHKIANVIYEGIQLSEMDPQGSQKIASFVKQAGTNEFDFGDATSLPPDVGPAVSRVPFGPSAEDMTRLQAEALQNNAATLLPGHSATDDMTSIMPSNRYNAAARRAGSAMRSNPKTTAALSALGLAGLGGAGYGAYEALRPPTLLERLGLG